MTKPIIGFRSAGLGAIHRGRVRSAGVILGVAIPIVMGVDHYLKFVVIVDDDVDVFNESDVLWAISTRVQADRDLVIISGSLGAILDPSATEQGVTSKLGIDATKPLGDPFAERLLMDPEKMAWARALADRLTAEDTIA